MLVSTSMIRSMERFVSKVTCVSQNGALNCTHSVNKHYRLKYTTIKQCLQKYIFLYVVFG